VSKRDPEDQTPLAVMFVAMSLIAGFTVVSVNLGPGFAIPVGICAAIASAIAVKGPLGKALAKRIEASAGESQNPEAIENLTRRVEQLEHIEARTAELEERLDFAERLLTQQRDAERLGPG